MVVPGCPGGMAEWLRQGPAKPCTRVRFPLPPRAISSVGERFLDTEEVTGSIPVSPTTERPGQRLREENPARPSFMIGPVAEAFPEHSFSPERRRAPGHRLGPRRRVFVGVVERVEDAAAVVGAVRVEVECGRRAFVSHHPLHHVRRYSVVHEPRRVGVAQVVEAQPARLVPGDVLHGLSQGPVPLAVRCAASSVHRPLTNAGLGGYSPGRSSRDEGGGLHGRAPALL